jgi:hypothetical protein
VYFVTDNIIYAKDITLHDLEKRYNLQLSEDNHFFPEWQIDIPEITDEEKKFLNLVRAGYMNLIKYPVMLENAVQLTVLSPLLHLASLLLAPFHIKTETSVRVTNTDGDVTIEGRIDILILEENFWVLVIESKRSELSIRAGLAQILAYMLASPLPRKPCYGMITNGGSYVFLKIMRTDFPTYGVSRVFDLLNPGNDLYHVLGILKKIRLLALNEFQTVPD